jgi:hypothetical protein
MRIEKLEPAPTAQQPAAAESGLLASNGCINKRDLDGSFNQIRIAGPRSALDLSA